MILLNVLIKMLLICSLFTEINNPARAQHCFIKSVKLENSSAVSWSNLGTLYLQHNHVQLANEAFQKAQSVDPKYSRSWIGQVSFQVLSVPIVRIFFYHFICKAAFQASYNELKCIFAYS